MPYQIFFTYWCQVKTGKKLNEYQEEYRYVPIGLPWPDGTCWAKYRGFATAANDS